MDHRRIEEMNIPELYATGRLSAEDEEAFETHLLECRVCREQVAWADDLGASVRAAAAETSLATARAATRAGLLVWLARPALRYQMVRIGLAAALLVLAGLPAWLLLEQSRLREELAEARNVADRAERAERPAPQLPAKVPGGSDTAAKAALDRLAQDRTRLEGELAREREARESLASRLASLTRPQTNPAFVPLGVVRGTGDDGEVELGPSPEWIYLSVDLPSAEHDVFRLAVYDSRDRRIWQGDGLVRTGSDTVTVLLYSDLLKPGEYRLRLEGVDEGRAVPAGELRFHVRRQGE
jgi:hypothetical protein